MNSNSHELVWNFFLFAFRISRVQRLKIDVDGEVCASYHTQGNGPSVWRRNHFTSHLYGLDYLDT